MQVKVCLTGGGLMDGNRAVDSNGSDRKM